MSLETPEDSMAAGAANNAEQTAQTEIAKQITSVGDAAAALISLADGTGAMNTQGTHQQAVMTTATSTVCTTQRSEACFRIPQEKHALKVVRWSKTEKCVAQRHV